MGTSTDAIIAYGFDIGEEKPAFLEGVEDSDLGNYLVKKAGLPEDTPWQKRAELEKTCPVEIIEHCSGEYPMYFLALRGSKVKASRGFPVNIEELEEKMSGSSSKDKVELAELWCQENGLETKTFAWHLFSMWW